MPTAANRRNRWHIGRDLLIPLENDTSLARHFARARHLALDREVAVVDSGKLLRFPLFIGNWGNWIERAFEIDSRPHKA